MPSAMVLRHLCLTLLIACALATVPQAGTAQSSLPQLRLVENLRLDAEVENFSVVNRVVVGAHGRMAVPLPQDMQVRIYDSTGRRVATVGRRGEGPGEFLHLGAITWIGDTLVIDDQRQRRVTYVSADGRVLGTRSLPSPLSPLRLGRADSTFRFFIVHAASPGEALLGIAGVSVGAPATSVAPVTYAVLSIARNGAARIVAMPPQYNDDRWTITIGGLSNPIPFALQPQLIFAADGSRFAFMTADQSVRDGMFAVAVFDATGDTIFSRRYSFRGVPIPASAIDSAVAAMMPRPDQREAGSDPRRFQVAARTRIPAVYAPVESLVLGLDRTVWITLRATAQGRTALVLDPRGTQVAMVSLPPRSRIRHVSDTHVWMTETDDLDLSSIVRYRISGRD